MNPRRSPSAYQAGVTVLIYDNPPGFAAKARAVLDRLAGLGANSVGVAFPLFQTNWTATDVHSDPSRTPSLDNLALFVHEAHQRGFTVMLRPLLDEESLHPNGQWRGAIKPSDPAAWFASYTRELTNYARFAQTNHVEILDVGTELVSLQADAGRWLDLTKELRTVYKGQLTYSANWSQPAVAFAQGLDFVGVDAFFPLNAPTNASAAAIAEAWQAWFSPLQDVARKAGKPLVITELGTTSEKDSYQQPWIWSHGTGVNLEAQSHYYVAACQALKPRASGMYWWVFYIDPPDDPANDISFAPEGKPAEAEIGRCYR